MNIYGTERETSADKEDNCYCACRYTVEVMEKNRENEREKETIEEGGGINLILAYSAEAP